MNSVEPTAPLEVDDAVSQRAADLFERRRFGGWNETDQAELDAWLAQSTSHYVAFLRVEAIAARADQLAALHSRLAAHRPARKTDYRRFVFPILFAASVTLAAVLAIPLVNSWLKPPDRFFSTDVGGSTVAKFADGTEIDLDTDTAIRVRMTTGERTVWLQRGEAWFHVAHNASAPFSVIVDRHRITDLGTEFAVHRRGNDIEVMLASGRATLSTDGTATTTLAPGDDAVATPVALSVTRKTPQQLADELAWRRGMLVFRNTPLSEAVRQFNRYNSTKLTIADRSIADLRVSAEIRNDNVEGFVLLARDVLNLRVDRNGSEIRIYAGHDEKTRRTARLKRGI